MRAYTHTDWRACLRPCGVRSAERRGGARRTTAPDWHAVVSGPSATSVVVGGTAPVLAVYDVARGQVVREHDVEAPAALLRRSARLLCCATPTGDVLLRDPATMRVEHKLSAHTGAISDMDVSGNLLVTCGFSARCALGPAPSPTAHTHT
jgi:PAB-dependent poly(A)-specific ribonuclease subunit 2